MINTKLKNIFIYQNKPHIIINYLYGLKFDHWNYVFRYPKLFILDEKLNYLILAYSNDEWVKYGTDIQYWKELEKEYVEIKSYYELFNP